MKSMITIKLPIFLAVLSFTVGIASAQDIASLYKQVNSSVVTILTESRLFEDSHQMNIDEGIGSGVLISEDGEILTAAHVVNDRKK